MKNIHPGMDMDVATHMQKKLCIKNGYNTKILFVGTLFFSSSTNQYSVNNLSNKIIF